MKHAALTFALAMIATVSFGQDTRLASICRIKGQEENVLRGLGLVVGLNGTGETNDINTQRALSTMLDLLGNPVSSTGRFDQQAQEALSRVKNATAVIVTATVPAGGGRSGDRLDCHVTAVSGKSLKGGRLVAAQLRGPNPADPMPYAQCEGSIQIADATVPTTGFVHQGCRLTQDVITPYVSEDGWVTFVLLPSHADFIRAETVAEALATKYKDFTSDSTQIDVAQIREEYVRAQNSQNIKVKVPEARLEDPVSFIAEMLEVSIFEAETEARVICNTRTGSIVADGNVEIGDVVFVHNNLTVDTSTPEFQPITQAATNRPKLQRLLNALQTLRVPPNDVIQILRQMQATGKLHAKLVIE